MISLLFHIFLIILTLYFIVKAIRAWIGFFKTIWEFKIVRQLFFWLIVVPTSLGVAYGIMMGW